MRKLISCWNRSDAKNPPFSLKPNIIGIFGVLLLSFLSHVSLGQAIASWNFTSEPGNQGFTVGTGSTNVTASNFTRGADLTAVSGAGSINSSGWLGTGNRYYTFGFTVAEGFKANLSSLVITTRSSNTGPGQVALRYSGDGFTTDLATWTQSGTTDSNPSINLSALTNLTGTVEFRIVAVGTVAANGGTLASTGTFRVTNASFTGTVESNAPEEPEPPTPPLVLWDFTGAAGNQTFTAGTGSTNVSALNFTRGAGVTPSAASNSISASAWSTDANDYFSFGFTVAEGYQVALQNLIIATRSSGTGPRDIALRYSVDNFTNNLATWTQSGTDFNNQIIDLSSLTNLVGEVEFRIVVTSNVSANNGTVASTGTFRVNNYFANSTFSPVQFNGTVSLVPPPTPITLVNWNFTGEAGSQTSTSANEVASGITARNFARGSDISGTAGSNSLNSNGWNAGDNRFVTFGFNVNSGKLVDLTTLQIGTNASSTGPRDMALRYSGDGFTANLYTWQNTTTFINHNIDLSSLINLQGEVEFRIVNTSSIAVNGGTVSSTGTFRITNYFEASQNTGGTRFIGFVKDGGNVSVPSLAVAPESLAFGTVNLNAPAPILTYQLSGTNLTNDVNLAVTAPFIISKDGINFSTNLVFTVAELASPQVVSVKLDNSNVGNFSTNITHQTIGTSQLVLPLTASVIDPFNIEENFNTSCPAGLPAGWSAVSVSGAQVWACTTFGRAGTTATASAPHGVQINGFASGAPQLNEDWLISPAYNLTDFNFPILSFWSRVAFSGPRLRLLISTDYTNGDPNNATWTELSDRFATADAWTFSQDISLTNFKTNGVRIAFVYTSSPDINAARWTLDDFRLRNSTTPPAPFLTTNIGNVDYYHFGIVPVGTPSAQTRTFNFSLSNGIENLVIQPVNGFEFSKNGIDFFSSLIYTPEEAAGNNQVTVRFFPTEAGAFSGAIQLQSGDISLKRGYLTGATLEREETLDVVTWNIEWFGSPTNGPTNDALQLQNVKTIIQDLDADVYAFQEITDLAKFKELDDLLTDYRGFLSPAVSQGDFSTGQKLAFLYKTATVDSVRTQVLLQGVQASDLVGYPSTPDRFWASGRLPFLFEVKTNIGGVKKNINLINVHTRSNGGGESAANPRYAMRKYDVNVLKDTLDTHFADVPFIILGDYNDDLDETVAEATAPTVNTTETSFINYINDAANYVPVTLSLSNAGLRTFIAFENVIDHFIISNEVQEEWLVGSERIIAPFNLVANYQNTTSDHLPVKVRFKLKAPKFVVGNCEFTLANFTDAREIIAVQAVTYANFFQRNSSYVIGVATGIRTDGRAGAWEIHNDCSIKPLRRNGNANNTTLLPNIRGVEFERGWRYVPTSISADGAEIFGIAINDNGWTHPRGWTVTPGTTVNIKFTLGRPFYGRIFGVSGQILCNNIWVETAASNYFVRGCFDNPSNIATRIEEKLESETTTTQVSVFPNPVQDKVQVWIESKSQEQAQISVFDTQGRLIYSKTVNLQQGANQFEVASENWETSNGLFLMRVQTASQGTYQHKLIKY